MILAAAGVLDGRRATSHWMAVPLLKPFGVTPVGDERVVRDGKVVTAAGVSAGLDFALAPAAFAFAERGGFLVEPVGRRLQLPGGFLAFPLALRELGFELGLRRLGRRSFAQHPVAVDVADLQFLRLGAGRRHGQQCRGQRHLHGTGLEKGAFHQNAVPIWN